LPLSGMSSYAECACRKSLTFFFVRSCATTTAHGAQQQVSAHACVEQKLERCGNTRRRALHTHILAAGGTTAHKAGTASWPIRWCIFKRPDAQASKSMRKSVCSPACG
jgi:hypothetical protein